MTSHPVNLLVNWKPPGLDRIAAIPGVALHVAANRDEALAHISEAEVAFVGAFDAEMLGRGAKLRWIQAAAGGVEGYMFPELVASPIPFTSLKGTFNVPAAEHALAMMLAFSIRLHHSLRTPPGGPFRGTEPSELRGKTVGIVGLGNIGLEIARRRPRSTSCCRPTRCRACWRSRTSSAWSCRARPRRAASSTRQRSGG